MDNKSNLGYLQQYAYDLSELIKGIDTKQIESISNTLHTACQNQKSIFCIGNGGSAATSSHFATDLSWGRGKGSRDRTKAVSLTSNTSVLTALSNDIGYERVFSEQLRTFLEEGDVVFAISASGNSPNIIEAVEFGNSNGGITIGLVGFDGGNMKSICQQCIHVESPSGSYELVEDVHHAICHMLSTFIRKL